MDARQPRVIPICLALAALGLHGCHRSAAVSSPAQQCGRASTAIQAIQGPGQSSPLLGEHRVIEAVVTHWLSQASGDAVYLQQTTHAAGNAASSGLLVDLSAVHASAPIEPGTLLRIEGTVTETDQQTSLAASSLATCGQRPLPAAQSIESLPLTPGSLERLEGMRITIAAPLTISDLYWLGINGQFSVASGGRLYQPTEAGPPGAPAQAMALRNRGRSLKVVAVPGAIDPANLPRSGDQLETATGVLGQHGDYQLYLEKPPRFLHTNPRPAVPARRGTLRVASFNVLNFFNGDGRGGGFPTPRGASTAAELLRQQAKIVAAMRAIDADAYALAELENDGYDQHSAISQLTTALNAAGPRTYHFVVNRTGPLGSGLIAVGLLYDPEILQPSGPAESIAAPPFDQHNRPPLVQRFIHRASGRPLTLVALHLKSKRCNDPRGPDADQGDGQSCWNATRSAATRFLAESFGGRQASGAAAGNVLMLGDYNANSHEDPLTVLSDTGFVNLMAAAGVLHSFLFRGWSGALDHAFANPELAALASASVWSINADEAPWQDYNQEHKTAALDAILFHPDAYRSSDHDPLIIDLDY